MLTASQFEYAALFGRRKKTPAWVSKALCDLILSLSLNLD